MLGSYCISDIWTFRSTDIVMTPHSWIKECLELFGIAEKFKTLLGNSMENWRVMNVRGVQTWEMLILSETFFNEILYLI